MNKRNGFALIAIAFLILIFATLTTVFIFTMSKDVFRAQRLSLKSKLGQYQKIVLLSGVNLIDQVPVTETSTVVRRFFSLDLFAPENNETRFFVIPLETVSIPNDLHVRVTAQEEMTGFATYAILDSVQLDLLTSSLSTESAIYKKE
jgi:type II secretory pathway pseudopilin PulG